MDKSRDEMTAEEADAAAIARQTDDESDYAVDGVYVHVSEGSAAKVGAKAPQPSEKLRKAAEGLPEPPDDEAS